LGQETHSYEYYSFFWNLISLLGYQIDLYHCVKCCEKLTPSLIHFSQNGLICSKCLEDDVPISPEVIKVLRLIQKDRQDILKKLRIEEKHFGELEMISNSCLDFNLKIC